jgi:hypothetical protein
MPEVSGVQTTAVDPPGTTGLKRITKCLKSPCIGAVWEMGGVDRETYDSASARAWTGEYLETLGIAPRLGAARA